MRTPTSRVPALVLNESPERGRVAYLPADIDRCFGRSRLADHAELLANLVRWTANDQVPLTVDGPGLVHCQLYRQDNRLILHLVNLSGLETSHAPVHQFYPVGPITVCLRGVPPSATAKLLVTGIDAKLQAGDESVSVIIDSIVDHEVVVIE